MVLWTIISPEAIFSNAEKQEANVMNVKIDNISAEVYESLEGYKIRRIFSTNPRDFLKSRFMPGTRADVPGTMPPRVKQVPPDMNWIEV